MAWLCVGLIGRPQAQTAPVADQSVAAQDKPDFSGKWILDSAIAPGPEIPRSLEMRWVGLTRTTVRGEPMQPFFKQIVITRELASGMVSETRDMSVTGGVMGGRTVTGRSPGFWSSYATRWEGRVLVFEHRQGSGQTHDTAPWTDRRETWALEKERLKIVVTTSSSETPARSVISFYRRP